MIEEKRGGTNPSSQNKGAPSVINKKTNPPIINTKPTSKPWVKKGDASGNILPTNNKFAPKIIKPIVNKTENKKQTPSKQIPIKKVEKKDEEDKPFPFSPDFDPKRVKYPFISKRNFKDTLTDMIPPEFIPNEILGYAFSGIFIFVILLSLFFVPYGEVLRGNISFNISVGLPMNFVNFDLEHPQNLPFGWWELLGLMVDGVLFLLISYILNVVWNYAKKTTALVKKKDKGIYPKLYKPSTSNPTLADKAAEGIFKQNAPKKKEEMDKENKTNDKKEDTNLDSRNKPSIQDKIGKPLSKPLNLRPVNRES